MYLFKAHKNVQSSKKCAENGSILSTAFCRPFTNFGHIGSILCRNASTNDRRQTCTEGKPIPLATGSAYSPFGLTSTSAAMSSIGSFMRSFSKVKQMKIVKVKYGRHLVTFPITQEYKFRDLLQDSARHFDVQEEDFELKDWDSKVTFPYSSSVYSMVDDQEFTVRLQEKRHKEATDDVNEEVDQQAVDVEDLEEEEIDDIPKVAASGKKQNRKQRVEVEEEEDAEYEQVLQQDRKDSKQARETKVYKDDETHISKREERLQRRRRLEALREVGNRVEQALKEENVQYLTKSEQFILDKQLEDTKRDKLSIRERRELKLQHKQEEFQRKTAQRLLTFNPRYDDVPVEQLFEGGDREELEEEVRTMHRTENTQRQKQHRRARQQEPEYEEEGQEEEEEIISQKEIKRFSNRLVGFFNDPLVIQRIQESPIYLPTDWHVQQTFSEFRNFLLNNLGNITSSNAKQMDPFLSLAKMHDSISDNEFNKRILPLFFAYVNAQFHFVDPESKTLKDLVANVTNLTAPHLWYQNARKLDRKIVLHVGPTNSGKTHRALTRLQNASSGIYCGPLRLLAQEIHERLTKGGVKCNLITGQQRVLVEGAKHVSCTVEMADLASHYEVGVIDEIQMLGAPDRGWAWTKALLGLPVKELHVCGDPSTMTLIERICKAAGEEIRVNEYNRLSPLVPLNVPLEGPYIKGDCIIAFSRKDIYNLKAEIEHTTNLRCCVIYGSLPPEARAQQAALFNDPDSGYDVLIASDAIGMGLNLNIGRLIFSTLSKYDGKDIRSLTVSEIKQIAGRAGRYGSSFPAGYVTTRKVEDLQLLHEALAQEVEHQHQAGLFPNYEQLDIFSRCFKKDTPFSNLLEQFAKYTNMDSNYFLADYEDMAERADAIDHLNMSLKDRYSFCVAPVDRRNPMVLAAYLQYAVGFASGETSIPLGVDLSDVRAPGNNGKLMELENLHAALDLYIWLSFRFEDRFRERPQALAMKRQCGDLIERLLIEQGEKHRWNRSRTPPRSAMQNFHKQRQYDEEDDEDELDEEIFIEDMRGTRKMTKKDRKRANRAERRASKAALRQRKNAEYYMSL